jgi:microcystin-dependent protein
MKRIVSTITLAACLAVSVHAQPALINYQGRLLDAAGLPLPNGNYKLEFNIFDSASGGAKVWGPFLYDDLSGNGHGAKAVVANGRFNVILGPFDTNGPSRPITNAFAGNNRFVEIKVNDGSPILPRQQFLSAPYALQSQDAHAAQLAQMAVHASNLVQQAADALCPPGTIVAFGGPNLPTGWLLCDGSTVSNAMYPRLFAAIGTAWGNGTIDQGALETPANPATGFNVPDLRGMFLRGRNAGFADAAWNDPDVTARVARYGGSGSGDAVGSVQANELKSHTHKWRGYWNLSGDDRAAKSQVRIDTDPEVDAVDAYGGKETRPNNAYVNYIIKY